MSFDNFHDALNRDLETKFMRSSAITFIMITNERMVAAVLAGADHCRLVTF